MGKVLMFLALVIGIWFATEYAAGNSPLSTSDDSAERMSTAARSGAKVQAAYEEGAKRRDSLLDE